MDEPFCSEDLLHETRRSHLYSYDRGRGPASREYILFYAWFRKTKKVTKLLQETYTDYIHSFDTVCPEVLGPFNHFIDSDQASEKPEIPNRWLQGGFGHEFTCEKGSGIKNLKLKLHNEWPNAENYKGKVTRRLVFRYIPFCIFSWYGSWRVVEPNCDYPVQIQDLMLFITIESAEKDVLSSTWVYAKLH